MIPRTLIRSAVLRRLLASMATVALAGLTGGCYVDLTPCDAEYGVCPPPDAGLYADTGAVARSIWHEDETIQITPWEGSLHFRQPCLCRADINAHPGEEVIYRGDTGLIVLTADALDPVVLSDVPVHPPDVAFIDVEGDGTAEFLCRPEYQRVELRDPSGALRWQQTTTRQVLWEDVDHDGALEFFITLNAGVQYRESDGAVVRRIGQREYERIILGQLDEDEELELLTHAWPLVAGGDDTVSVWNLDGSLRWSVPAPLHTRPVVIVPSDTPGEPGDVLAGRTLYGSDGQVLRTLSDDEAWDLSSSGVGWTGGSWAWESQLEPCERFREYDEPIVLTFRAQGEAEPFRAELTYSIARVDQGDITGWTRTLRSVTRAILRVYDPAGQLVYHEVFDSASGMGSAVVIDSDVAGEQMLLLAVGPRVLAFRATGGGE